MTSGQTIALQQLQEISDADPYAVEILSTKLPSDSTPYLTVEVSLYCGDVVSSESGIRFHARERFCIFVYPDFPFQKPDVSVSHTRFEGRPHVQWRRHLCLYQAPQTEWNPEDGMFGFVDRLTDWIRKAAVDQLDPEGAPLHPPAVYVTGGHRYSVVPKVDAPALGELPWLGFAQLRQLREDRVDVVGWTEDPLSESLSAPAAVAILLNKPFPWEFPTHIKGVLSELGRAGVSTRLLLALLRIGVLIKSSENSPLYVLLGTPMRGIRGEQPKQHLTAWRIPSEICRGLRSSLPQEKDTERILEIRKEIEDLILEWTSTAEIHWCSILEARSEVTVRRDTATALEVFRDRIVLLWGCGALGAHVAIHLARAGVKKLILVDWEIVRPGVLVRQPYSDNDIGRSKVKALADHLRSIRPETEFEIDARILNLVSYLTLGKDWTEGADSSSAMMLRVPYSQSGGRKSP